MKTIRTKVYQFSELSESAKQTAIEWYRNRESEDYSFVWDNIKDDAKEIGLKIISLDDHKSNEGEFMLSAAEVAANIIRNHGNECETYKTAISFLEEWEPAFSAYIETEEKESELMDIEERFLQSLLEDYRIMYNQDIEAQNEDEYIIDAITANEYYFTKDGKIFHS